MRGVQIKEIKTIPLKNDYITAIISQLAAEVISLKSNQQNKETIWQRNPEYWRNCNPILFPILGSLENNQYTYKEKDYTLASRGFARDSIFEIEAASDSSATLSLTYNDHLLAEKYPFKFKLLVTYTIEKTRLTLTYKIVNLDESALPFQIGFHPAFNLPFNAEKTYEDCKLIFEKDEHIMIDNQDLGITNIIDLGVVLKQVNSFFFFNSTIQSDYVTLTDGITSLTVSCKDYQTLGFWHKNIQAPLLAIEPWLPKNDLKKANIFRSTQTNEMLPVGQCFECEYYFELSE